MPEHRRTFLYSFVVGLLLMVATPFSVGAQTEGAADWQKLRPEGEEFTIDMPKDPKFQESQEPYHRMTLNTRLYLSATERGPVLAVASLSGIKSNPALYSDFERFNSYVDAFKNWFSPKVRSKDGVAKLTLVGDKTLNGNPGREYRMVIGDLSGTVQVYTTRRRFYAVVSLNPKKDDVLSVRFLSSFYLPDKIAPPAAGTATAEAQVAPPVRQRGQTALVDDNPAAKKEPGDDTQRTGTGAPAEASGSAKPPEAGSGSDPQSGKKPPVSGGVLNGRATSLPQPVYPPIALQARASGTVVVQVLVDEQGNVISAQATSGHALLQAAAVAAARQATFQPTFLLGEPTRVTGVLTYTFTLP
jgi:TonB family protein